LFSILRFEVSLIGSICRQAIEASALSLIIPKLPLIPPVLALLKWHVTPSIFGSLKAYTKT